MGSDQNSWPDAKLNAVCLKLKNLATGMRSYGKSRTTRTVVVNTLLPGGKTGGTRDESETRICGIFVFCGFTASLHLDREDLVFPQHSAIYARKIKSKGQGIIVICFNIT